MLDTGSEILNIIIAIFIYSWIIDIAFGVILALSYPIFKKVNRLTTGVYVPFYNLFELCDLNGYNEKIAFLFLIPGVNIIMSMLMSYKLKDKFNTSGAFNIGLLFFSGFFLPLLAYGKTNSSEEEEEEPETFEEVPQEEVKDIDVDSIFKSNTKSLESDNKPYKAKKVKVNQTFINSEPAKQEKVEKID